MKPQHIMDKYKGLSFADAAEKIANKYKDRNINTITASSYEYEMKELAKMNELAKLKEQVTKMQKEGKTIAQGGVNLNGVPEWEQQNVGISPFEEPIDYLGKIGIPLNNNMFNAQSEHYKSLGIPPVTQTALPPSAYRGLAPTSQNDKYNPADFNSNVAGAASMVPGIGGAGKPVTYDDKFKEDVSKTGKKGFFSKLKDDPYTPAYIGAGISALTNGLMLAGGYDKVNPQYNMYENDIKRLMQSRGINSDSLRQGVLGNQNAALDSARNVRSSNVNQALNQNIFNSTSDALSNIGLQEQQGNNAYKGEYATMLGNLGSQRAQANVIAEDLTARNKGQFQSNLSAFAANVADNSKFFTKAKLAERYDNLMSTVLANKYPDVTLGENIHQKVKDGSLTIDDIIKMGITDTEDAKIVYETLTKKEEKTTEKKSKD